jgi:hypothetical protein
MRLDPGSQLPRAERLGDVIVAADFQAQDTVDLFAPSRQEQNRDARQGRLGPQLAAKVKAVAIGQHDIQDDQIRPQFLSAFQSAFELMKQLDAITAPRQIIFEQGTKVPVILHNEDRFRHWFQPIISVVMKPPVMQAKREHAAREEQRTTSGTGRLLHLDDMDRPSAVVV